MGHVATGPRRFVWPCCSILNKIWDLAPPLIGVAVDVVVTKEDSLLASFGVVDPWHQLLVLAAVTVAIWALESLFEYGTASYGETSPKRPARRAHGDV